jgi:hypothetical protein
MRTGPSSTARSRRASCSTHYSWRVVPDSPQPRRRPPGSPSSARRPTGPGTWNLTTTAASAELGSLRAGYDPSHRRYRRHRPTPGRALGAAQTMSRPPMRLVLPRHDQARQPEVVLNGRVRPGRQRRAAARSAPGNRQPARSVNGTAPSSQGLDPLANDLTGQAEAKLPTIKAEHRTVAAAFDSSCQLLTAGQQRFFRLLGLNPDLDTDRTLPLPSLACPSAMPRNISTPSTTAPSA